MKYAIVYMNGNGLSEKNQIKTIIETLPIMEFNLRIEKLEGDINDISNYDNTLLSSDTNERLNFIKSKSEFINSKISENNDIIKRLNDILKMKMNKIKSEQVTEAETLQRTYLDNYAEISENYERYLILSLEIEEILRKHGSTISDAKQFASDFGTGMVLDDRLVSRSDSIGSEDSLDFM